jgi:hypothetical protein
MEDMELDLNNFNEMGTSIDKIKHIGMENKELFKDLNTSTRSTNTCGLKKNFNINNFVKDLENNLDNFDNIGNTHDAQEPQPSNIDFKKEPTTHFIETLINTTNTTNTTNTQNTPEINTTQNDTVEYSIYNFLINIKEPLIIVLIFILLNNNELVKIVNKLPFIKSSNSDYPSLILRGVLLAIFIYYLRKMNL